MLTVFFRAISEGNYDVVHRFISEGIDLNSQKLETPPLHYSLRFGRRDTPNNQLINDKIAKLLIERGADIEKRDDFRLKPIHLAANACSLNILLVLLERGAEIDAIDSNGKTALHLINLKQDSYKEFEVLKALLSKGANVNAADIEGKTVLHYAVNNGYCDVVSILLNAGANPLLPDSKGKTALDYAEKSFYDIPYTDPEHLKIQALLNEKILEIKETEAREAHERIVNFAMQQAENEALLKAVSRGTLEDVKKSLARGADANMTSDSGKTLLCVAVIRNETEMTKTLLRQIGVKDHVNKKFSLGQRKDLSLLQYAAQNGNLEIVKALLDAGAYVNSKDADNFTALHAAVESGNKIIVETLIGQGADVDAENFLNETPLAFGIRWETERFIDTAKLEAIAPLLLDAEEVRRAIAEDNAHRVEEFEAVFAAYGYQDNRVQHLPAGVAAFDGHPE